jgi:hypothetical protein
MQAITGITIGAMKQASMPKTRTEPHLIEATICVPVTMRKRRTSGDIRNKFVKLLSDAQCKSAAEDNPQTRWKMENQGKWMDLLM